MNEMLATSGDPELCLAIATYYMLCERTVFQKPSKPFDPDTWFKHLRVWDPKSRFLGARIHPIWGIETTTDGNTYAQWLCLAVEAVADFGAHFHKVKELAAYLRKYPENSLT